MFTSRQTTSIAKFRAAAVAAGNQAPRIVAVDGNMITFETGESLGPDSCGRCHMHADEHDYDGACLA